jgi:hypothetical protein
MPVNIEAPPQAFIPAGGSDTASLVESIARRPFTTNCNSIQQNTKET